MKGEPIKIGSDCLAMSRHRSYHFLFASGLATSRVCSMKSRATGLSVRFFRVMIATGSWFAGNSMGKALSNGALP